ncbi:MAG: DUF4286 family protein [Flavobacteriales bacterium]|nr:DUF4286 family protein [Flavobacteriales bacterium]
MIIYNVTVNIDENVHDDWVKWMRDVHIPDVMATGFFLENRFARVLVEDQGGITYSIQYLCKNMADLEDYQREHAARLQSDHNRRYEGKFVAFRTLLETVE